MFLCFVGLEHFSVTFCLPISSSISFPTNKDSKLHVLMYFNGFCHILVFFAVLLGSDASLSLLSLLPVSHQVGKLSTGGHDSRVED